jgi:hypothetical protein
MRDSHPLPPSEFAARVAQLQHASDAPSLTLLHHKWGSIVLGVFERAFGHDGAPVRAERMHSLVEASLEELEEAGLGVPPNATGRSLCLSWTQEQWLVRLPTEDGAEEYERTSHALAAARMLEEASRERALISESRLTTIMDTASRWAATARPGHEAREAHLRARIAEFEAELEGLEHAQEPSTEVDAERLRHGYADLADLLAQLPGDFRHVEESIAAMHRQMLSDFRQDTRPRGEVLDDYLEASRHLMEGTEAGRAFSGALALLGNEDVLHRFRDDLKAIVDHPFARELSPEQRRSFVNAASLLRRGLYEVQSRQHKASRALAEQLQNSDAAGDRQLARLLNRAQAELSVWMRSARPRDAVSLTGMPARSRVQALRSRFFDPTPPPPVELLEDVSAAAPPGPELEAVRLSGGPLLGPVRLHLRSALEAGRAETLAQAFDTLPPELRRPVELYGLMDLAAPALTREREALASRPGDAGTQADPAASGTQAVRTIRPDGTERWLTLPTLTLTREDFAAPSNQATPQTKDSQP